MNTKNYPDFLVSPDIALALKKIGFRNENCLFKFDRFSGLIFFNEKVDKTLDNSYVIISIEEFMKEMTIEEINNYHFHSDFGLLTDIPTWEQVFEWFREKKIYGNVNQEWEYGRYNSPIGLNYFYVINDCRKKKINKTKAIINGGFDNYEEAREELVIELIKTYKREQYKIK